MPFSRYFVINEIDNAAVYLCYYNVSKGIDASCFNFGLYTNPEEQTYGLLIVFQVGTCIFFKIWGYPCTLIDRNRLLFDLNSKYLYPFQLMHFKHVFEKLLMKTIK